MTRSTWTPRSDRHLGSPLGVVLWIGIAIVLPVSKSAPAQVPATQASSQLLEVEVAAPSLEGNLMGTATVQGAAIYLPPSYDQDAQRQYPTIYLLHGIFDHYQTWLPEGFDAPGILDRLSASDEIPEVIAVMPNGFNPTGGGFYRNSQVSGNWADFVADDLVGYVDDHYRTLARPESRAVTGHSMGGYGSIHLGMTRPDVFSVVWAMSPCCLSAVDDLGFGNDAWRRAIRFESPADLQTALQNGDFYPVAMVGLLYAFSPNLENPPFHVDFPYELVGGETVLIDSIYDPYLDRFPVRQVDEHRDALRGLRGLGMGFGLGDQFIHIPTGTMEFSQKLGEQRVPHVLDVFDGDHRQLVAPRLEEIVLPWIGNRLVTD